MKKLHNDLPKWKKINKISLSIFFLVMFGIGLFIFVIGHNMYVEDYCSDQAKRIIPDIKSKLIPWSKEDSDKYGIMAPGQIYSQFAEALKCEHNQKIFFIF